jgi:PKD repeat protein
MRPFFPLLSALALTTTSFAQDPCPGLHALFSANVYPNEVQFANATSGTGFQTTWSWTFGDGSGSNAEQPGHVYAQPGSYTACLTAISIFEIQGGGLITCVDTTCQQVFIPQTDPCDSLGSQFQSGPGGGANAIFYSVISTDADHWVWSFGDGTFSDSGPQGVHEYPGPGTYELCLTASYLIQGTQDTCTTTTCHTVVIPGTDPCDSLHACFSTMPMGQQNVMFTNCSTAPGTNLQYTWHFGDGSSSSETSPDHTYTAPGVYSVCLVAYWENCVDEYCQTVVIQGGGNPCDSLNAEFMFVPDGGPHTIFYSASNGNGPHWLWSFGDGTYSDNGPQGTHVYPGAGPYELCLTVWQSIPGTQDTCSTTMCQLVNFGGSPCDNSFEANFQWVDQMNGSAGFYGISNPAATGYLWSFGDGSHGDGMNPAHAYAQPGEYHVCLSAWYWNPDTQDTCWAEHCEWITISGQLPCDSLLHAHFVWEPAGQGIIHFQNTSVTNGQAVAYAWTFGDGGQSDGLNPLHTYIQSGEYQVCFTVYALNSPDSCSSTVCQWISVQAGTSPCAELNAGFTVWPGGLSVNLQNTVINPAWSYDWLFGDGHFGSGPNAGHVYVEPGTYLICLIVGTVNPDTQDSCFADHCQLVTVTSGGNAFCDSLLQAQFSPTPLGQGVWSFANGTISAHPQLTHYLWTFGDGSAGDGYAPTHTYAEPGVYQVCMTAWMAVPGTSDTCSSTTCHFVEVSVGLAEQAQLAISVWPQPVEQMLVVEGEALQGEALFTAMDMTGRVVFERTLHAQGRAVLDVSALATGTYVLRIGIGGEERTLKLLKR